jgi:autotransporter-associated beta strand protein
MLHVMFRKRALARIAAFCLAVSALRRPVAARLNLRLLATAALLLPATSALAQTTLWTGNTGSWFSAGNWSAGVPGPGSDAQVASGTAQIAASTGTIQSLTVWGSSTVDLQAGGTLSATNGIFVGDAHTPGTLLLSGSSNLTGPITIGGGTLWSQVNGTLSNNMTVDPNMGGFLKVQSGNTLTLAGSLSGYPLDVRGGRNDHPDRKCKCGLYRLRSHFPGW